MKNSRQEEKIVKQYERLNISKDQNNKKFELNKGKNPN